MRVKKKKKTFNTLTSKIFLKRGELKIDLLTEVLYELAKMCVARIQFTGESDKLIRLVRL